MFWELHLKRLKILLLIKMMILLNFPAAICDTGDKGNHISDHETVTSKGSQNIRDHNHDNKTTKISESQEIGIEEKLGQTIPLDLFFYDEEGKMVKLNELITRPTIVALIFFSCRATCPMLLGGVANVLGKLQLKPGVDYSTLTISFDHTDTPEIASQAKVNYIEAIGKPYPKKAWRFLTGNKENIKRFTDSLGFRFKKERGAFSHIVALIILSPKGKIVRYLYGTSFLAFDLAMSITEASEEREGISVKKVLLYCFSYNPEEKRYVFNVLKVVGTATLIFVVALFVYLTISSKRARKRSADGDQFKRSQ